MERAWHLKLDVAVADVSLARMYGSTHAPTALRRTQVLLGIVRAAQALDGIGTRRRPAAIACATCRAPFSSCKEPYRH